MVYIPIITSVVCTVINCISANDNAAWIGLPSNYQTGTAVQKSDQLWNKIVESTYNATHPKPTWGEAGGYGKLFATGFLNLSPAFTCNPTNSDVFPYGRVRGIHNIGAVGRIEWKMLPDVAANKFTGFLAKGANAIGLARFSLATSPDSVGYVPGVGVKLFMDGSESVNFVMMDSLDGQGKDSNYFTRTFRTTVPHPTTTTTKIIGWKFGWTESPANSLPVRECARYNPAGNKSATYQPSEYPYMLRLVPDERIKNIISSTSDKDFRDDLLEKVTPGVLYHVHAATSLDDTADFEIGTLSLTTKLVASDFGDTRLCFRHQSNTAQP